MPVIAVAEMADENGIGCVVVYVVEFVAVFPNDFIQLVSIFVLSSYLTIIKF